MSELEKIAEEIKACTACLLHRGRTQAVPGAGPESSQVVFVGEAPGFHEDQQALPFVGAAGKFLDELLDSVDLDREKVFITNIIKCRPPANRDPLPDEIAACNPHLQRQLEVLKPQMIVTLGRFSMARFFPKARISQIHGQPRRISGLICLPMYHPAAALHQPSLRQVVKDDFQRIPEILAGADSLDEYEPPPDAEQLRLF